MLHKVPSGPGPLRPILLSGLAAVLCGALCAEWPGHASGPARRSGNHVRTGCHATYRWL